MSAPVPSPSMKGRMGRSGTSSVPPELIRIASPPAGMTGFADAMAPSSITKSGGLSAHQRASFARSALADLGARRDLAIGGQQGQALVVAGGQDHALGHDAAD